MEWNVYYYDTNHKKIQTYNIFTHESFKKEVLELFKRKEFDKDDFQKELDRILMYYFWTKAEWEILLKPWVRAEDKEIKIDVYSQVKLNWEQFVEYVWTQRVIVNMRRKKYVR